MINKSLVFLPKQACVHTDTHPDMLISRVAKSQDHISELFCVSVNGLHSPVLMFGFQENHCDMRISLNQKPNSSKDFGFLATWDSTGAHVTSIQPGNNRDGSEKCLRTKGFELHRWSFIHRHL